jgi:ATP-dependent Clp protease ATP-binding subunit ClpC
MPKGMGGAKSELGLLGEWNGDGARETAIAFHPSRRELFIGCGYHIVRLNLETGKELQGFDAPNRIWDLSLSPDGAQLAAGITKASTCILSTEAGATIAELLALPSEEQEQDYDYRARYSPNGAMLACGGKAGKLRVFDAIDCTAKYKEVAGNAEDKAGTIYALGWSADSKRIAVAQVKFISTSDIRSTVVVYRADTWKLAAGPWTAATAVNAVEFSRDGLLAVATDAHEVLVLSADLNLTLSRCEVRYESGQRRPQNGPLDIAWSADGRHLAGLDENGAAHVWNAGSGELVRQFEPERPSRGWRIAWAPGDGFLVTAHRGGAVRFWDTKPIFGFEERPAAPVSPPRQLSRQERELANGLTALISLGCAPPLSLLRDLASLLGGERVDSRVADLGAHARVRDLAGLGFPATACFALALLLLRQIEFGEWRPPRDVDLRELRIELEKALAGEETQPEPWPPPLGALRAAADAIPPGLPDLIALIGHKAFEKDPGLALRLIPTAERKRISPKAMPDRRLLTLRIAGEQGGRAQAAGGSGVAGIATRGSLKALLPTQLALGRNLMALKLLRSELLYRARTSTERPRLRPAVLLLDVSPPNFGPVERLTRTAAHVVAATLIEAGVPARFVAAGGNWDPRPLENASDLLLIWTKRSFEQVNAPQALSHAHKIARCLKADPLEPIVIVFSHTFFCADDAPPALPELRAVFGAYPGCEGVSPPLAAHCKRHVVLKQSGLNNHLETVLSELFLG